MFSIVSALLFAGVELLPPDDGLTAFDLSQLAAIMDVSFGAYDYDVDQPHCMRLTADDGVNSPSKECYCSGSGKHRLLIITRKDGDLLKLKFAHSGGSGSGSSSGRELALGSGARLMGGGHSDQGFVLERNEPALAFQQTVLYPDRGEFRQIEFFLELLDNPDNRNSSGGDCRQERERDPTARTD